MSESQGKQPRGAGISTLSLPALPGIHSRCSWTVALEHQSYQPLFRSLSREAATTASRRQTKQSARVAGWGSGVYQYKGSVPSATEARRTARHAIARAQEQAQQDDATVRRSCLTRFLLTMVPYRPLWSSVIVTRTKSLFFSFFFP